MSAKLVAKQVRLLKHKASTLKDLGLLRARRLSLHFREAPPLVRPIFVVGTVRSATTIVARILGNHPDVCHPKHAHFELSPEWCDLAGISIAAPVTKKCHCPPLDASAATETVCESVRDGFADLCIVEGGRRNSRFLNKSPHLWNKLPFVKAIFADAHLVVACRDIVSTVASTKLLWEWAESTFGVKHYLPIDPKQCWQCVWRDSTVELEPQRMFPGGDVAVLAEYWLRVYRTIDCHANDFDVATSIKHSDFVGDPQAVCNALGQAVDISESAYPTSGVRPSTSERWREKLTKKEQKSLADFISKHRSEITALQFADTSIIEVRR